ncbi:MAG: Asp-tRNA(Asn)/Glu-tRNA(Gln) amidotransferase subunit GatB [Myxococcota bacterium]
MSTSGAPNWQPVIGLEVHAQLRTSTKIFCSCPTSFGAAPNTHVCPVCLGLPGALPVLNRAAVQLAVRMGLAVDCTIAPRSVFARKNYFYPDLPKGYQISQAELPVCLDGHLNLELPGPTADSPALRRHARIQRIHLEEDAGKSIHGEGGAQTSAIDLNRAGTPLIEIVGHPDLRSADEAVAYLKELRAILLCLGVCDGNMEEGSLRCDANVSVHRPGEPLGTRCEIKNVNSFKSLRDAIAYEIDRQVGLLNDGQRVVQQTRLWSQERGRTEAMRSKEDANDYRYFPDPDLPALVIGADEVETLRKALPELPAAKRARLRAEQGVTGQAAAWLVEEPERLQAFLAGVQGGATDPAAWATFLMTQAVAALTRSRRAFAEVTTAARELARICDKWRTGGLSNRMLNDVLTRGFASEEPLFAALQTALTGIGEVVSDTAALEATVDQVLAGLGPQVEKYRSGQVQLFGFFVGQVMRVLDGKGDAQAVNAILRRRLG